MHYIISPWVFYLLHIAGSVKSVCLAFLVIFAVVIVVYGLVWFMENEYIDEDKFLSPIKILKRCKVPLILSVAILVFVPSTDTIYKMLIASQVTTENIDTAKETIQDVADYIVDAVKEIKEKEDD